MVTNILLVLLLGTFAVAVAFFVNRRSTDSPTVPKSSLPIQVDRNDFEHPETEWILVFFSSDSCDSCGIVRRLLKALDVCLLHIQEVTFPKDKFLHQRYGIESVPIVLLAGVDGVVVWSYAGVPHVNLLSDALSALQTIPPKNS
jgi:hypothetical protein